MRSDMAYRPAMGFLAHSIVHSAFILARSCRWSFAMVVVSVAGSSSVASFANSSALSFPSMFMCPGTHDTSIFAPPKPLEAIVFKPGPKDTHLDGHLALWCHFKFLISLSLRRWFRLLMEDAWRRRVLSWMTQIRAKSLTRRIGLTTIVVPGPSTRIRHKSPTGRGTCASDNAVYIPHTDS